MNAPFAPRARIERTPQPLPPSPPGGRGVGLTPRQADLLAYLRGYIDLTGGVSPSFSEIAIRLGLRSKGVVHRMLTGLEDRGHIHRLRNRARAIGILEPGESIGAPHLNGEPLQFIPVSHGQSEPPAQLITEKDRRDNV